ncbi:MAG: hypothetical protein VX288_05240 [Planctomycetota bacterium]|nr:hypothetical protein [Planctomycetota bacterium]
MKGSTSTPGKKPQQSLQILALLRRKIRTVSFLRGLSRLGSIVALALLVSFGLDYFLNLLGSGPSRGLPFQVRLVFLLGASIGFLYLLVRGVLAPLSNKLEDAELAMLVEESNPQLNQALVTAVELCSRESAGSRDVSRAMLDSVVEEVEAGAESLLSGKVLDLRRLKAYLGFFCLVAGFIGAGASWQPELASIWLQRNVLLDRSVDWPKSIQLEIEEGTPEFVAVGDDLPVGVRVLRGSPRIVEMQWELEDGSTGSNSMESSQGSRRFVYVFRNVSKAFSFKAVDGGGEDETEWVEVKVRNRPRIDMKEWEEGGVNRVAYRNPVYTGKSAEEVVQRHGNLKVPAGTKVSFRLAANVEIAKAYLVLKRGVDKKEKARVKDGSWPDPDAAILEITDGRLFSGNFVVEESGSYFFQFEDPGGFRSTQSERFRIQAVADRKPVVRIVEPQRLTEDVSPRAEVPILAVVKDDYAVKKIELSGSYYSAGETAPERNLVTLLDVSAAGPEGGESEPKLEPYILKVGELGAGDGGAPSAGARFEFFVLAEDFGAAGGGKGNIGESQVYLLQVVDPEYLEDQYAREVMALRDIADRLRGRQESVRKDLEESQRQFLLGEKLGKDSAGRLSRHRQDQVRVSEGLLDLSGNLGRLLAKMKINKVGEQKWKDWLTGLEKELTDISKLKSDRIAGELDELRSLVQESDQDPASLGRIVGSQFEVERDLESIVVRMSEFGDLRGLIQLMRDIKRRQEGLRDNTRSLLGGSEGEREEEE